MNKKFRAIPDWEIAVQNKLSGKLTSAEIMVLVASIRPVIEREKQDIATMSVMNQVQENEPNSTLDSIHEQIGTDNTGEALAILQKHGRKWFVAGYVAGAVTCIILAVIFIYR